MQSLLADPATVVLVSAATVWELSLRHHQGKLPELERVIGDLPRLLQADGFQPLSIALAHALRPGPAISPTAIATTACSPPRPNWSDSCCSPPIPSSQLSSFPCRILW